MPSTSDSPLYSPTQLTQFIESPFAAWMDQLAREHPELAPEKDPADSLSATLSEKGYAHEAEQEGRFREQGLLVLKIDGHDANQCLESTRKAMADGVDVIVQARLQQRPFAGYSDFLVKVEGPSKLGDYHYEVWDTKLASRADPRYLIQLCCYTEMLASMQDAEADFVTLVLGNGEIKRFQTRQYLSYYRLQKQRFLEQQAHFHPEQMPDPADSPNWGNWSNVAKEQLLARDHLFQVAGISRGQIKKLIQANITSMQALANTPRDYVSGINPLVLQRLKSQARIQKQTQTLQQQQPDAPPCVEIRMPAAGEKSGLALLPPHSNADLFFDIEGFPLDEGGLEYLWGCTYFDDQGERQFRDFWAHNREQEKQAFVDFIQWVYQRWRAHPGMHIYHYANYEIAACRKLMGRFGCCEDEVDQLLRNDVFVDLYNIVRSGILLGEPRYSIKNVEHLYRGKRETDVGTGGDSVVVYEQWRERLARGEEGDRWQTSPTLNSIRDYNIDDCDSTQELVAWLREQQTAKGIAYLGKSDITEPEIPEEITERTRLRDRLLERAATEGEQQSPAARLSENLAWLLEFHRREAKPVFWKMFERLGLSPEELLDDLDCLAFCDRTEREPFKRSARTRNLGYEYRFDPTQEFKGAARQFFVLGEETENGTPLKVDFMKEESDLEQGLIMLQAKEEPPAHLSLVPYEFVNPAPIPDAIDAVVAHYADSPQPVVSAIVDFLQRSPPRFRSDYSHPSTSGDIAPASDPGERLQQIIQAVSHIDNSYLTIQGPPGAGKSYTGKHIIAALISSGAKVGIASNSHKAINNLLISTARYCQEQQLSVFCACTKDTDPELAELNVEILKNNQLAAAIKPGCVIGTTAWGFARDDMADQLDYLFVDEAGQVAVANLVAISRSCRNLILMGDQMQLGQPSQGTHPADSGLSVLDYLLHDSPTIPSTMGVFLGTTYRMHSRVNRFVSNYIYDSKLTAHPSNDLRTIAVPSDYQGLLDKEAGIIFIPVVHEGNTQAAEEEVDIIQTLAKELLGRTFQTGKAGSQKELTRPIDWSDILFVAPYNHQVSKLKQALGDDAKVGSVDKFQGQEAPIVFLSMCASDAGESPRGLEFLFDKHRLNVALSRAQSLAIVVANPALAATPVATPEQMALVNLFAALMDESV